MKKIFFLILFLAIIFCFPLSAFGANLEITVGITSVRIPEAAINMFAPDGPNTEFTLYQGTYITLVDDSSDSVVAGMYNTVYVRRNETITISYSNYDITKTYKVYFYQRAEPQQQSQTIYKADCTPVAAGSGWYYLFQTPYYVNSENRGVGFFCGRYPDYNPPAYPWPYWHNQYRYFAVDPNNVVSVNSDHYWRLLLFTID